MVLDFETWPEIFWLIDSDNHDDSFGFSDDFHDDLDKYWMDRRGPSPICERVDNRLCGSFPDKPFSFSISEKNSEQDSFRINYIE